MIGPVKTSGATPAHTVKLRPSGVEVDKPVPAGKPSAAAELAAQGAPVDTSRVAELRSAIAEGRYAIDSRKVADAMIASEGKASNR